MMFDHDGREHSLINAVTKRRQAMMDCYFMLAMMVAIYESNPGDLSEHDKKRFNEVSGKYEDAMSILGGLIGGATDDKGDLPVQMVIAKSRMEMMLRDLGFSPEMLEQAMNGVFGEMVEAALGNIVSNKPAQARAADADKMGSLFRHLH